MTLYTKSNAYALEAVGLDPIQYGYYRMADDTWAPVPNSVARTQPVLEGAENMDAYEIYESGFNPADYDWFVGPDGLWLHRDWTLGEDYEYQRC